MKNFNIFGVHRKIRVLGGVHKKPIYRGDCLKTGGGGGGGGGGRGCGFRGGGVRGGGGGGGGGAWTVCRFKEGLGKKEWG